MFLLILPIVYINWNASFIIQAITNANDTETENKLFYVFFFTDENTLYIKYSLIFYFSNVEKWQEKNLFKHQCLVYFSNFIFIVEYRVIKYFYLTTRNSTLMNTFVSWSERKKKYKILVFISLYPSRNGAPNVIMSKIASTFVIKNTIKFQ